MKRTWLLGLPILVFILLINTGCSTLATAALLGIGKNATKEDTGFFSSYENLEEGKFGEPDLYFIASDVNWNKYRTIAISDFSSLTTNHIHTADLQNAFYKNHRKDIADTICSQLDGSSFKKCKRIESRLDPKSMADIKNVDADIILMGNIKELRSLNDIVVAQHEIKIVEKKTGREILRFIDRQNTGKEMVARPLARKLHKVLEMAREKSTGQDVGRVADKSLIKSSAQANTLAPAVEQDRERAIAYPAEKQQNIGSSTPTIVPPHSTAASDFMVIGQGDTQLRSKPSTKAMAIRKLRKGEKVQVKKQKNEWCLIEVSGDETGWCLKSALAEMK